MFSPLSYWSKLTLTYRLLLGSACALTIFGALLVYTIATTNFSHARADLKEKLLDELAALSPALTEHAIVGDYATVQRLLESHIARDAVFEAGWIFKEKTLRAVQSPTELTVPKWFVTWSKLENISLTDDLSVGGVTYGTIYVRLSPNAKLNRIWQQLTQTVQLLFFGAAMFFLTILVVVTKGLAPLYSLAVSARRFRDGDYTVRVPLKGPPEILANVTAFNSMADRIEILLTNNRLLTTAIEQSNDAIFTKSMDCKITSWNAGAVKLFGYSAKEAIGLSGQLLRIEGERSNSPILASEPVTYETTRVDKRGKRLEVEISTAPLFDDKEKQIGEIIIARDIAERKRIQGLLHAEKERAQVTLQSIGDAVITTDVDGNVEYLNPIAEKLTGWSTEEAYGKDLNTVYNVISEEDAYSPSRNLVEYVLRNGAIISGPTNTQLHSRSDHIYAIEDSASPIRDRDGNMTGVVLVFRDVTHARTLAEELSWQASHDELTKLYNRREFARRLESALDDARRGKQHALLYVDLDQFKIVNDTCGHVAGDELLCQIGSLLKAGIRKADVLARLGGDEFGILLEGCTAEQGLVLAESFRQTLANFRFMWEEKTFASNISIGVVSINQNSPSLTDLLSAADAACYAAKEKGRNRIHLFSGDDGDLKLRRGEMQWVTKINEAIEDDWLCLYQQAILPTSTIAEPGEHYEILVRLIDENQNIVLPGAFIPAAERYGLMPAIDRTVVHKFFAAYSILYGANSERKLALASINLSGATLNDEGFLAFVFEEFQRYQVPPNLICFEITETAAIANLNKARVFLTELKKLGCRFALDDFGSGLSSFGYLKNLPVDYLKIDGSFIKDIQSDATDFAMVQAINNIGRVMGLKTVAEFVENQAIATMLTSLQVDFLQGYAIAMPAPLLSPQQLVKAGSNSKKANIILHPKTQSHPAS